MSPAPPRIFSGTDDEIMTRLRPMDRMLSEELAARLLEARYVDHVQDRHVAEGVLIRRRRRSLLSQPFQLCPVGIRFRLQDRREDPQQLVPVDGGERAFLQDLHHGPGGMQTPRPDYLKASSPPEVSQDLARLRVPEEMPSFQVG